ncbi:MAG: carbohydrate ABC transporter permease, partial [Candidatus Atribacteria bacterium]|nr:carbohydrate ABC transporter permease [Candidatus Atribacteria bacterium]MCD6350470.1 carbohydrate ABC transporter permease [Candidatus Atribacteria bacterium]
DGCSEFKVFWKILLPVSGPAVAALFIIDFLATWNEFLMALIFIRSNEWKTVPLGLMSFQGQFGSSFPLINAGVVIAVIPVVVVYVLLQRYFVSGITAGALKE